MKKNKLMDFVGLNEMTKQIVLLAGNIELMSMNALLTNKDSNGRSGFSAVSEELRGFSLDVKEGAKQLSFQFSLIISQVACESKLNRRARNFHATQIKIPHT